MKRPNIKYKTEYVKQIMPTVQQFMLTINDKTSFTVSILICYWKQSFPNMYMNSRTFYCLNRNVFSELDTIKCYLTNKNLKGSTPAL